MEPYLTISKVADSELVEKKSRFIAHAAPVTTVEEAETFIAEIKKLYRDASHNVFAYNLRSGNTRYSDDGEPSGTAGMPSLEVLRKLKVVDACVVVTRYFGGVLLGASGLVRAYGSAAAQGIKAAELIIMKPCLSLLVSCDYSSFEKLKYLLSFFTVLNSSFDYGGSVSTSFALPTEQYKDFTEKIVQQFNARVPVVVNDTIYAPFPYSI